MLTRTVPNYHPGNGLSTGKTAMTAELTVERWSLPAG